MSGIGRREVMAGLATAVLTACAGPRRSGAGGARAFTILSPAPEATPLHVLNADLVAAALARPALAGTTMAAVALPLSINQLDPLSATDRSDLLPIVTAPDWPLARDGTGPDWHGYARAHPDLLFVSALYEVGFGVQALVPGIASPADLVGRRIAAPPRPSAVRMLTEAVVRDGWGLADRVELVDSQPFDLGRLLGEGRIDATSWNLVLPSAAGAGSMIGPLALSSVRPLVPVDPAALARMNAANPFTLSSVSMAETSGLLSFRQGLAAWRNTDPVRLTALLEAIAAAPDRPGLPNGVADMARWPALRAGELHPVARAFYVDRGVDVG